MGDAPARFPPPVADTIDWLEASFGRYYKQHPPSLPDRFTRREFGFILWPERPGPRLGVRGGGGGPRPGPARQGR